MTFPKFAMRQGNPQDVRANAAAFGFDAQILGKGYVVSQTGDNPRGGKEVMSMHALELLTTKFLRTIQAAFRKEDAVVTLGDVLRKRKVLPDPGNPRYDSLLFTTKAIAKMKAWGLSEADVADVFFHGTVIKEHLMARKYSGYEIGLVYGRDRRTGQYIIYSAWKRERR